MPTAANSQAVFLDRDGTIIEDTGYASGSDQIIILPGVADAIASLNQAGFKVIVITNQSGVGRGFFDHEAVYEFHEILNGLLALRGARVDAYYFCPHAPDENGNPACGCRKPGIDLFLSAKQELGVDLELSFLVGDRHSDVEAGKLAGCKSVLLMSDKKFTASGSLLPDHVAPDLPMAVDWIMTQKNSNNRRDRQINESRGNH